MRAGNRAWRKVIPMEAITPRVDGQLAGDVRVFSGSLEQVMSEVARQVMSVLGSCEKSRDHLR